MSENSPREREEYLGLESFMGRSDEAKENMRAGIELRDEDFEDNDEGENLEKKRERYEKKEKYRIKKVFERKEGDERIEYISKYLVKSFGYPDSENIERDLKECASIENEEDFVERVFSILG